MRYFAFGSDFLRVYADLPAALLHRYSVRIKLGATLPLNRIGRHCLSSIVCFTFIRAAIKTTQKLEYHRKNQFFTTRKTPIFKKQPSVEKTRFFYFRFYKNRLHFARKYVTISLQVANDYSKRMRKDKSYEVFRRLLA